MHALGVAAAGLVGAAFTLARLVEAPPAPWVSDRSPIGLTRRRLRSA